MIRVLDLLRTTTTCSAVLGPTIKVRCVIFNMFKCEQRFQCSQPLMLLAIIFILFSERTNESVLASIAIFI